jgi:amino acid transporter
VIHSVFEQKVRSYTQKSSSKYGQAVRFGPENRIANGAWILVEAISPYVQWMIFFGMSLSVIMIIYNGFLIISDPGGDKTKSAKENIKNIIIGVLVLGGFYFIMRVVSGLLLKLIGG